MDSSNDSSISEKSDLPEPQNGNPTLASRWKRLGAVLIDVIVALPVIFVVELAGVFIKPVALAIRLFANMVGGHVLLATLLLLGSTFMDEGSSPGVVAGVSVVSGIAAVLITFLELFVAFLQAFIFMFLTAVFISLI